MHLVHKCDVLNLEKDSAHLTNKDVFFPELVWGLILGKIKNPVDIESCSNASLYFWKFLESKRKTKVVFPVVLQQLSCFFDEYKLESDSTEKGVDKVVKSSMKPFLDFRLVCKHWNIIIEDLHHSSEGGQFRLRDDMEQFENEHLSKWANDVFHPDKLPQQFLHHFDPTHYDPEKEKPKKNPFLGRSVSFKDILLETDAEDEDQIYFDGILEMLTKYGEEIWYANFDFVDLEGTNLEQLYNGFVQFLTLMPNLRALRVSMEREYFDDHDDDNDHKKEIPDLQWMVLLRLGMLIKRNPIPTLSQLEYLRTTDLPSEIFDELLQKNGHVTRLQVDRKERHSDYMLFKLDLPNLNALGVSFCGLEDFEEFENCPNDFNIHKFYFWYNGPSENLTWSRLFQALERQLGENCVELLIGIPLHTTEDQSIQTFDDTHSGRLNLPNLQQIAFMCDSTISLDFLLPAKNSLRAIFFRYFNGEEDKFVFKRFEEYKSKQLVKFIGFQEIMEDSNIWVEFPMLMDFTLFRKKDMGESVSYTRERSIEGGWILEKDRWYRETI